MKRILVLGALVASGALSVALAGYQGQAPQAPLPGVTKVKDNL